MLFELFVVTVNSIVISKMALSPSSRLTELESRLSAIPARTSGPCGGFTAAYRCACDYHGVQFVDEIAWVGLHDGVIVESDMLLFNTPLCITVDISLHFFVIVTVVLDLLLAFCVSAVLLASLCFYRGR